MLQHRIDGLIGQYCSRAHDFVALSEMLRVESDEKLIRLLQPVLIELQHRQTGTVSPYLPYQGWKGDTRFVSIRTD